MRVTGTMSFLGLFLISSLAQASLSGDWNKARGLILENKTSKAITLLNKVGQAKQSAEQIGHDQVYLNLGRSYYQKSQFSKALEAYSKVPTSSDFWALATEESAWTYVAMGQEEKALAKLQSLMSPIFSSVIGSEPYYLKAFAHLRICDYKGVFKTTKHFKKAYASKIKSLEEIVSQKAQSTVIVSMSQALKAKKSLVAEMTSQLSLLPHLVHRDKQVQSELGKIQTGKSQSINGLSRRIVQLAQKQLKEIEKHLSLLHVIEAQAIPRVALGKKAGKDFKNSKPKQGSEWLHFPVSSEEVWIDELDSYHVQIKDCPRKRG